MRAVPARSALGLLAAGLVAVIAGVHFEQYVDFMSQVPTVGVLFLLNASGGAGLALALLSAERWLRVIAALGAIGLAAGSLGSIAIALSGSFFGYSEPTLRVPILIAIFAEAFAIPVLLMLLRRELTTRSAIGSPHLGSAASPR
jgi:hypothetical protein